VNALNALVGAEIFFTPGVPETMGGGTIESIKGAEVLFVDGANPVYASPAAAKLKETIEQIPYIVSFGNFIDETSVMADLILPDHSFLESWVQATPESGAKISAATMAGPVMQPLHETRSTGD